ncbi:MAG: sodium:solute symporter [Alphaproteobacteria bacterium]
MTTLDMFCLTIYFVLVAIVAIWTGRGSRKDSKSFFLAGGSIGWVAIGASIFASNISTEHFIGLAGTGASSGLAVAQFEILACLILLLLGWLFVPFYLRTGVFTMPEFLERRFNSKCRTYLSGISIVAYVFTKVSVAVYAGALVLNTMLGWNMWLGAIALILATGVYTVFGGLKAVIYTDFFQAFVLVLGAAILTGIAVTKVGGVHELLIQTPPEFMSLWKSASDPDFPWTGIIFGAPLLGIWYWCTDQMIVQRTLASRNVDDARKATVMAGFLKILPMFLLVLPGLAGRIIYPDVAPDAIYATMVNNLLVPGVKGFVVAALLSALMSSLSSVFNSGATLMVMDFYKRFKPETPEKKLVHVGQATTGFLILVSLAWLPFIGVMSNQLYVYLQSVQGYISPPITAVFLLGVLWKRANGKAAFAALITGFIVGAARFLTEVLVKSGILSHRFFTLFAGINFLHFAFFLFALSLLVIIVVSLLTAPPTKNNLSIFAQTKDTGEVVAKPQALTVMLSILLGFVVIGIWLIFSPLVFN